jgi:hypothetical protein
MTKRGVERTTRTAYLSSLPPVGVSTLMPPHSQGAERRTERRAGRTGSRWALRALVVGGLAGAAWLLTGAAAHAADRDPASEGLLGSSLIGAVVDGDTAPRAVGKVGKVLTAAAQPLASDRTTDRHSAASSVLSVPARVLSRPAGVLTDTLDEAAPRDTAVDQVVRDIAAPLRPSGGPAESPQLIRDSVPVADPSPQSVAEPVAEAPDVEEPAPAAVAEKNVAAHRDIPRPERAYGTGSVGTRHTTVTHRHQAAVSAVAPDSVRDSTPAGDVPAPVQVHLGALSGISTSGPGAPTEGGSAAVLPAAVGGGPVAHHRMRGATDVEVRRHDAEAPTVSPD